MVKTVQQNYAAAPFYREYDLAHEIEEAAISATNLAEFNLALIRWVMDALGIKTKIVLQSHLDVEADRRSLPVVLCKKLGCDTYLSGQGARMYNDPEFFEWSSVKLIYQSFQCPEYRQRWMRYMEFQPNLSVIDLLFNCGPKAGEML